MKTFNNPEHIQIIRNLRSHPKYSTYTATQFAELIRVLFPEYRTIEKITEELQVLTDSFEKIENI